MKKLTQTETKQLKKSFWEGFFFMFDFSFLDFSWMLDWSEPKRNLTIQEKTNRALVEHWQKVGNYMHKAITMESVPTPLLPDPPKRKEDRKNLNSDMKVVWRSLFPWQRKK